jgi:hypothetical protein
VKPLKPSGKPAESQKRPTKELSGTPEQQARWKRFNERIGQALVDGLNKGAGKH